MTDPGPGAHYVAMTSKGREMQTGTRTWERGRLARLGGREYTANPHRPGTKLFREWLSGWLYQDDRIKERNR